MTEKLIPGFSNYVVTACGKIFSLNYNHTGTRKELRQKVKAGYMNVGITDDLGIRRFKRVHRLVAETFIENQESKPEVNHKNGNKSDNRVENLEWATTSENRRHAFDTGLQKPHSANMNGNSQGSKLPQSKLDEARVSEIRTHHKSTRKRGERTWEKYGIAESTYWYVVAKRGGTWKHV